MTSAAAPASPPGLLSLRGIVKRFGPTCALAGADLEVKEREIHGLVGASGAGKSALVNIVAGLDQYDTGEFVFRGYPINLRSRCDGLRIGIALVAQEAGLLPDLSVYDNIVLPSLGRVARAEPPDLRQRVASLLAAFGGDTPLPLDAKGHDLSMAQARIVALARALAARAKLYVFDEPFASLAPREIDGLVGVMLRLRMSGCGLIVAVRHLDDTLPFADRVTVLAEGRTVLTANPHSQAELPGLRHATGGGGAPPREDPPGLGARAPLLLVNDVAAPPEVTAASLTVGVGEIVALHGLKAAGCATLLEAIAGLRPRTGGGIALDGARLVPDRPRAAVQAGIAFAGPPPLPQGTARDNIRLRPRGPAAAGSTPVELFRSLMLPEDVLDTPLDTQPSGVQRRVAIAGALAAGARIVLLDDPTRGLAPHERAAVHATLRATARGGCAILLSCPDREEVPAIADRCVLVRDGRTVADLPASLLDAEALTLLASPAAAMARNTAVLAELTRENGGAAFWALRRDDHVIWLNAAIADAGADPGLPVPGAAPFAATRIATALGRLEADFVAEPDGSRTTVLVPIHTRRGRPLGLIGLTLGRGAKPPPAAAVAFRIEMLAATL